jgi:hypothetical protein
MTAVHIGRKLPVPRILAEAITLPWERRAAFAKALALPAIAIVATQVGWYLANEQLSDPMKWAAWGANKILWVLFAVICHRLVLLGLRPADVARVPGWGSRETLFLGWLLLLWAIIMPIVLGLIMVFGTIVGQFSTALFDASVDSIQLVIGIYFFARLSLVFPATAIDVRTNPVKAWRQTRGNGWRLVVVIGVFPWAFGEIAAFISGDEPGIAKAVLVTALTTVLLAVEISALSLSYRELTQTPDAESEPVQ